MDEREADAVFRSSGWGPAEFDHLAAVFMAHARSGLVLGEAEFVQVMKCDAQVCGAVLPAAIKSRMAIAPEHIVL